MHIKYNLKYFGCLVFIFSGIFIKIIHYCEWAQYCYELDLTDTHLTSYINGLLIHYPNPNSCLFDISKKNFQYADYNLFIRWNYIVLGVNNSIIKSEA